MLPAGGMPETTLAQGSGEPILLARDRSALCAASGPGVNCRKRGNCRVSDHTLGSPSNKESPVLHAVFGCGLAAQRGPLFGQGRYRDRFAGLGRPARGIEDLHDNDVGIERGEVTVWIDVTVKHRSQVIE